MTLRVTLEIVPFGQEESKYELAHLNIHNRGVAQRPMYTLTPDERTEYIYDFEYWESDATKPVTGKVHHYRDDGALVLAGKVVAQLGLSGAGE